MPRTTVNSLNSVLDAEMQSSSVVSTPVVPTTATQTTNKQSNGANNSSSCQNNAQIANATNSLNRQSSTAPIINVATQNSNQNANARQNAPLNINLTERQFADLLGSLQVRQETRATFSSCSARFNGGRSTSKIEDFIATILVFKEAERISDSMALTSLPLLLEGYASSW